MKIIEIVKHSRKKTLGKIFLLKNKEGKAIVLQDYEHDVEETKLL